MNWQERLASIPRFPLAGYPTPLEPLERLARHLGVSGPRLWIKRDDGLGPAMGGNKARKLEYLLADALAKHAPKVATFGGLQSNHARMTAAAANKVGLEAHLFFFEPRPREMQGNLLLDELLGARLHFIPLGSGGGMSLEATCRLVRLISLLVCGPGTYFIPVGGHSVIGCLGYVAAAVELHQQAQELGLRDPIVVLAAGSGGTLAGLLAGFALLDSPIRCLGIDVGKLWRGFPRSIARMVSHICAYLGQPLTFTPQQVPLIEGTYVGPGYGQPTKECLTAIRLLASAEGILLDPVYTGKAFAGLLDLLRRDHFAPGQDVIFLHTGGIPGLFAFSREIMANVLPGGH